MLDRKGLVLGRIGPLRSLIGPQEFDAEYKRRIESLQVVWNGNVTPPRGGNYSCNVVYSCPVRLCNLYVMFCNVGDVG